MGTWQEESATSGHPMGIREYTRHSESDWDIDSDKQKMATHHAQPILVNLKSNTYEKNTVQRYCLFHH